MVYPCESETERRDANSPPLFSTSAASLTWIGHCGSPRKLNALEKAIHQQYQNSGMRHIDSADELLVEEHNYHIGLLGENKSFFARIAKKIRIYWYNYSYYRNKWSS